MPHTPKILHPAVLALALILTPALAQSQTVTLEPTRDTSLYSGACGLSNGSGIFLFAGNTFGQGPRRALLHFDVAGAVPPGSTVESVSLILYANKSISGPTPFTLHRVQADWGEGASNAGDPGGAGTGAMENDATWCYRFYSQETPGASPAWTSAGSDFDPTVSASYTITALGNHMWSSEQMAADVQGWLDNPETNFGYVVKGQEDFPGGARRFFSREHATPDQRPRLMIQYGAPDTPPTVEVISPNGGETLTANEKMLVQWVSEDEGGIASHDLFVSIDGGATYQPVAVGLDDTTSFTWFPPNRPTTSALFRVLATDNTANTNYDDSDAVFTVLSPEGGLVATTMRDFDQPGTQPLTVESLGSPQDCASCHGDYGQESVEPLFTWQGSMMANASLDPLFEAALVIANQDAPESGDLCIRCHDSRAWLGGRSVPTDRSQVLDEDKVGVSCNLCHRMVDPVADGENPEEDEAILSALDAIPTTFGGGQYVVDPNAWARRGPFIDATSGHAILVSPFHREAAFCGTCHDVSNPAFSRDAGGKYVPNALDTPAPSFSPDSIMAVERTYSEWFFSAYNTPEGVYAPQFGGNKDYVATCQDCHMRDVTGMGANGEAPLRTDLPLHDLTGGSTWIPSLLADLHPGKVNPAALDAGIERARAMLQAAAELSVVSADSLLTLRVTNNTGHKLPTGYPEGRRIWLNVRFYDDANMLVGESAAYDPSTGVLDHDGEAKIYEIELGTEGIPGLPDSSLFHFVLSNMIIKDNRIPPRGFTNAAYQAFGGPPVGYAYPDSQYWDDSAYTIPRGATTAKATLYYQSTSKEFIEFLRDENTTNTKGQEMYDLWNENGKCPPELMDSLTVNIEDVSVPVGTFLAQNFPNPLGTFTTLRYTLEEAGPVLLQVFDIQGRLVKTLVDAVQFPRNGWYEATWDATGETGLKVADGLYFYRLETAGSAETRKMVLIRQ